MTLMLLALTALLTGCGISALKREPSEQEESVSTAQTVPAEDLFPEVDFDKAVSILEVTTTEPPTTAPPETTTQAPTDPEPENTTEPPTEPHTPSEIELAITLPLNYREVSENVSVLQNRLIELGYLPEGAADGSFGPLTYEALSAFQEANSLPVTGDLDEETLAALRSVHARTAYGYWI